VKVFAEVHLVADRLCAVSLLLLGYLRKSSTQLGRNTILHAQLPLGICNGRPSRVHMVCGFGPGSGLKLNVQDMVLSLAAFGGGQSYHHAVTAAKGTSCEVVGRQRRLRSIM
jgi:hypothetical protein